MRRPDEDPAFDLLTMGRVGVDIYPLQAGLGLAEVETFGKYLGGSPTNVAVAAARYGRRAAVITRTGDDPFGLFIHRQLHRFGVDDRYVTPVTGLPTPVTFCEIFPPDNFPLYFYRYPKAPDLEIQAEDLDKEAIRGAAVFWATVTGLSEEPSRSATLEALSWRQRRHPTVLDLDYRPMFWESPREASKWTVKALAAVTVAVGNLDECQMAVGTRDPIAAAEALLGLGVQLAVIKMGPAGVHARSQHAQAQVGPLRVAIRNGLGAGDAFGRALCHGLLAAWPLDQMISFANAAGAIVATQVSCSDAMPSEKQVTALLAQANV